MAIVRLAPRKTESPGANNEPRQLSDVTGLAERFGLTSVPVDVIEIAKVLGLRVSFEAMDDSMSGFLERRTSGWVLGVNVHHHPLRQRFTVAHEIAHFVLHRDQNPRGFKDETFARRNATGNQMERQADQFAAELLMPEEQVRKWVVAGVKSLNELAAKFGVSSLAMKYRLLSLNYKLS
jgi:Zn-dependent peptidase ImmA (M78 family)